MQISPDVHDVHDVMYYELDDCFRLMRITNNNIYYYCYRVTPFFKLRRMNVYMHTVATVTAMGNKELFQTYDEVRSKHPKELKARVKIGAGSGKKSVLDVLVAFMTKRANLFGGHVGNYRLGYLCGWWERRCSLEAGGHTSDW